MSNVVLTIHGRQHTVACAQGEEQHLMSLARAINEKIDGLGEAAGHSEGRTLLFAALLLADEVHDLKNKLSPGGHNSSAEPVSAPAISMFSHSQMDYIATKLENLAARLETRGGTH